MSCIEDNPILDEETLQSWKKKDLVKWLEKRKKKKSGNKRVLIHRIIRSLTFDCSDDSDDTSGTSESEEELDNLPQFEALNDDWQDISTGLCPPLREDDVENYYIYNKNPLTGKSKKCHRQLKKARKFANENFVFDIAMNSIDPSSPYCYVKGKCKPSMKEIVTDSNGNLARHYSLYVVIVKKTGKIDSALCDCKPGVSGLCSHVGGLLLTLVKISTACTSRACGWLQPQTLKKLSPKRLCDIKFVNPTVDKEQPIRPYPDTYQAGPCKDPEKFLQDIMAGLQEAHPNSVLFTTLNPDIVDIKDVLAKYEPDFMYTDWVDVNNIVCQSEFRRFVSNIELTDTDIKAVSESTKGQSCNPKWKEMRSVILTASNFGSICKRKPETRPDNLIKKIRSYGPPVDSREMRYGRKKEAQARKDYARHHITTCGCNVVVETTGVVISKDFPYLGASVDGIINCDKCGRGALEIKCPFNGRKTIPKECVTLKNFCCHLNENEDLRLKEDHNYMFQVMGQMKILSLNWCDFVIWTKKGFHVERIHYDEEFWQGRMLFKLKFFYSSFFTAELYTHRVKRDKELL